MNQVEITRLAAVVNALRPEWPNASLVTFITRNLANRAYPDAVIAFIACAVDDATKTPARLLENGPWWKAAQAATGHGGGTPTPPRFADFRCRKCGFQATEPGHQCGRRTGPTDEWRQARAALKAGTTTATIEETP